MNRVLALFRYGFIGCLLLAAPTLAFDTPKALAAKGLERNGATFVLAEENALGQKLRNVKTVQANYLNAFKVYDSVLSQDLAGREEYLGLKTRERALRQQLIASIANPAATKEINQLMRAGEARQNELHRIMVTDYTDNKATFVAMHEVRKAYVEAIRDLAISIDKLKADYSELEKDPAVKTAIEEQGKSEGKMLTLGPSRGCLADFKLAEKYQGFLLTQAVTGKQAGGRLAINVEINGKATTMEVSPGAAKAWLNEMSAAAVGATPTDLDPVFNFVNPPDQKKYSARRVRLASLKIGDLEIRDVIIFVKDRNCPDQANILGDAFLNCYLVWNIDESKSELSLAEISDPAAKRTTLKIRKKR